MFRYRFQDLNSPRAQDVVIMNAKHLAYLGVPLGERYRLHYDGVEMVAEMSTNRRKLEQPKVRVP